MEVQPVVCDHRATSRFNRCIGSPSLHSANSDFAFLIFIFSFSFSHSALSVLCTSLGTAIKRLVPRFFGRGPPNRTITVNVCFPHLCSVTFLCPLLINNPVLESQSHYVCLGAYVQPPAPVALFVVVSCLCSL